MITRRGLATATLAGAASIAVSAPAEARKKRYHNQGRRNPNMGSTKGPTPPPTIEDGVLLNPNVDNIQDQHRNSRYTFPSGDYVECERPNRLIHDTCEADIPGGAHVTWENTTD